jgi:flagellar basal-body rod protein FlgG
VIRALFTSSTGMISQQLNVDTIANNIANVNTTGFKKSRVNFQDLLYETIKPPGTETTTGARIPEGIQVGHGVRPAAIAKVFTQGNLILTGNQFDLVIEGDGFFQIELPDGTTSYTRDGSFKVDADGNIVTTDGYPIVPALTLPNNFIQFIVNADGNTSVITADAAVPQVLGQINLVRFVNPSGLDARLGRNLLLETEASGPPQEGQPGLDGLGTIAQGFLENSNVQVVEEIVNLIIAQRAYEANANIVSTADEMLQVANNVKR